jgi:hypothetical protein
MGSMRQFYVFAAIMAGGSILAMPVDAVAGTRDNRAPTATTSKAPRNPVTRDHRGETQPGARPTRPARPSHPGRCSYRQDCLGPRDHRDGK